MPEYKVVVTWEAIYDITDIAEYIETEFGKPRADRFQSELQKQLALLSERHSAFTKTPILYRGYFIHKKPFSPSIIFYIIDDHRKEVHILRVMREERNWEMILSRNQSYTYPD